VRVLRAPLMPVMGLLVVAAWLALTLWAASPYGRYLDHGSWSDIGLAAAICRALPAGEVLLPGLLYVGGWLLMTAAIDAADQLAAAAPLRAAHCCTAGSARPRLFVDRRLSLHLGGVRHRGASARCSTPSDRAAVDLTGGQWLDPGRGRARRGGSIPVQPAQISLS